MSEWGSSNSSEQESENQSFKLPEEMKLYPDTYNTGTGEVRKTNPDTYVTNTGEVRKLNPNIDEIRIQSLDDVRGEYAPPVSKEAANEKLIREVALDQRRERFRRLEVDHKKVSHSDSEYQELRQEKVEFRYRERIFGDGVAYRPELWGSSSEIQGNIEQKLADSQKQLVETLKKPSLASIAANRRARMELRASGLADEIGEEALRDKFADEVIGGMSLEQYNRFLYNHVESQKANIEQFGQEFDKAKARFVEKIGRAVAAGGLPASAWEMSHAINETKISLYDTYSPEVSNEQSETLGVFFYEEAAVFMSDRFLSAMEDPGEMERVMSHELLHVISGRTARIESGKYHSGTKFKETSDMRVGLEIFADDNVGRIPRFKWLNEAVTEHLALRLEEEVDSGSYKVEREIYKHLASKVPESYFNEAYFEKHEPGRGVPKWHELNKAVDAAFEPGYLLQLDKAIKEYGADKVLEILVIRGTIENLDLDKPAA